MFDPPRSSPPTSDDLAPRPRAQRYEEQKKITADMNWAVKQEFLSVGLKVDDSLFLSNPAEATCSLSLRVMYDEAKRPRLAKAYAALESDGWKPATGSAPARPKYRKDNHAADKSKYASDQWQLSVSREHDFDEPGSDVDSNVPGKYVNVMVDNCTSRPELSIPDGEAVSAAQARVASTPAPAT
ncbi:hypothetical protein AB0G73_22230 [Streptomyces sp. NPDC020719]|uniref:hypothetical protein n=1 Tax=Streptomyces sp. NPDC020719 TaxID=3154896 RepID=UPI0033F28AF6